MTSTAVASYQPVPPEPASPPRTGAADALPVFASDGAAVRGAVAPSPHPLAELAVHRRAETPLSIGIFGPPGSGKTRFLSTLIDAAGHLAAAAGAVAGTTPFLSRVVSARVEAAPGRGAVPLIVGSVLSALGEGHAAFAEDAVHAGGDPREAARLAGERVNALRRSLDGERQTLDELSSRRARLTDAVLFDAAGSRLDGFARANRGRIEARLSAFGLGTSDPIRTYKELVRQGAEAGGGSRLGLTVRALWAFKGQGRLIVLAVLLAALGWAAGLGADDPDAVADWLAGFGDRFAAVTDWGRAHLDLLQPVSRIAVALAALAVLAAVVRAARFLGPIFKGAALLKGDLAARRRDLDGLLAHQTRRVDGLAAEAEAAGRGAEVGGAARRRAPGRRPVRPRRRAGERAVRPRPHARGGGGGLLRQARRRHGVGCRGRAGADHRGARRARPPARRRGGGPARRGASPARPPRLRAGRGAGARRRSLGVGRVRPRGRGGPARPGRAALLRPRPVDAGRVGAGRPAARPAGAGAPGGARRRRDALGAGPRLRALRGRAGGAVWHPSRGARRGR